MATLNSGAQRAGLVGESSACLVFGGGGHRRDRVYLLVVCLCALVQTLPLLEDIVQFCCAERVASSAGTAAQVDLGVAESLCLS
jgi:hypothetical protein